MKEGMRTSVEAILLVSITSYKNTKFSLIYLFVLVIIIIFEWYVIVVFCLLRITLYEFMFLLA